MLLSAQEMHTCIGIFVHKYPYSVCVLDIQAYLKAVEIPIYQTRVLLTDLAVFIQTLTSKTLEKLEFGGMVAGDESKPSLPAWMPPDSSSSQFPCLSKRRLQRFRKEQLPQVEMWNNQLDSVPCSSSQGKHHL